MIENWHKTEQCNEMKGQHPKVVSTHNISKSQLKSSELSTLRDIFTRLKSLNGEQKIAITKRTSEESQKHQNCVVKKVESKAKISYYDFVKVNKYLVDISKY